MKMATRECSLVAESEWLSEADHTIPLVVKLRFVGQPTCHDALTVQQPASWRLEEAVAPDTAPFEQVLFTPTIVTTHHAKLGVGRAPRKTKNARPHHTKMRSSKNQSQKPVHPRLVHSHHYTQEKKNKSTHRKANALEDYIHDSDLSL